MGSIFDSYPVTLEGDFPRLYLETNFISKIDESERH